MFKLFSRLFSRKKQYLVRFYAEPLSAWQTNSRSGLKPGTVVWTPDGLGTVRGYDKQSNLMSVYLHKTRYWKDYDLIKCHTIVSYNSKLKRVIQLSTQDYKYLIMNNDFEQTPVRVRLTTHGRFTLTQKEKEKRRLIALLNSKNKTTGRKILFELLNNNYDVLLNK